MRTNLESAPSILGDGERLQQLFLNLFLNAADAMPEGGAMEVNLASEAGGIRFDVSDDGVGVAAEDLERLFEPFFTTKDAGQGNGLG